MKAADISDRNVLAFLEKHQGQWCTWFPAFPGARMPSVHSVVPADTPEKVLLAKMKALIRRGLVSGCDCGCRGDYEITREGLAFLMQARHHD